MAETETETPLPPPRAATKMKPRTPLGTRMATWVKLWARDTFSRDQMISSLKSLAWVAPLTILIWVYAEREQILTQTNQTIPITVKSSDPRMIVTIDQDEQSIIAEISGPHASVDKVIEELKLIPNNKQGVVIEIPPSSGSGSTNIRTSLVSENDLFKREGVTVSKTSPEYLHVRIDHLEDRDVEVKSPADVVANLVNKPTFEPRTIKVTGPKEVLAAAEAQGKLNVYANFKGFGELTQPGKHDLNGVPLTVEISDRNDNITVVPLTVKASLEVKQLAAQLPIPSLPIWITYPPGFDFDTYKVVFNQTSTVTDVTLFGPSDHIEPIRRKDPSIPGPKARIELVPTAKPVVGQTLTAKLIFDLPYADVHVSDDDEKRTVDYHFEKKDGAP